MPRDAGKQGSDLPDEFLPKDAADFIRSHPECIVIDVREPQEYAAGHIEGAENIDYHSPTFLTDLGRLDPERVYMLYCRRGIRAANVQKMMKDRGFSRVYCVQGGIDRWKAEGNPVITGP